MASLSHAQAAGAIAPEPVVRPRPRTRARTKKRARGGILWIFVSGILLTGVVFVNVAVLRLNLSLDSANTTRSKLVAQNAALQSDYAALLSSTRIEQQAMSKLGLVYEDPGTYGHINVAK
jgi:cell division protein FtsL